MGKSEMMHEELHHSRINFVILEVYLKERNYSTRWFCLFTKSQTLNPIKIDEQLGVFDHFCLLKMQVLEVQEITLNNCDKISILYWRSQFSSVNPLYLH